VKVLSYWASTILGGRNVIEQFIVAGVWPISDGWQPPSTVFLDVDWSAQRVPFPRFNLRLKEGQSLEDFISEVEGNVDAMVSESTLNEYQSFKALVKHKRRVNRVFSELGAETALRSLPPGVDKKVPTVAVATCLAAPPKAPRKKTSKKGKRISEARNISSSTIRHKKTKSLESSKRKCKASESVSDDEVQAASSLAQLGSKCL
jgi:hypothetical protein